MWYNSYNKSIYLLLILQCLGCASSDKVDYGPDAYIIKGIMQMQKAEVVCWQLTTTDIEIYQLIGSDIEQLMREGLKAELIVRDITPIVNLCTTGKTVEVLEIIKISQ